MAGTSEGGKKAAATRGHESLSKAGRKGGQARGKQRSTQSAKSSKSGTDMMGSKKSIGRGSKKEEGKPRDE